MYTLPGAGGFSWWRHHHSSSQNKRQRRRRQNNNNSSSSSNSVDSAGAGGGGGVGFRFPLKQALTAGSLALTGDTIAQVRERMMGMEKKKESGGRDLGGGGDEGLLWSLVSQHDWVRALRMASYGFLLYGPGSYVWYQYLDRQLPQQTVGNLVLKVFLNQVVLGPCVIAVALAWNNLWLQKLSDLPRKYQKDFLPTLFYGFRFWIPVSALNFWVVPLQGRVAFMSLGSIFWNFVLSSTMSR